MRADSLVYPHDERRLDGQSRQHFGLSVRDYIAIQAMQGFCANNICQPTRKEHYNNIASDSYFLADAMIAESQREAV
jgi:hypothetical protein